MVQPALQLKDASGNLVKKQENGKEVVQQLPDTEKAFIAPFELNKVQDKLSDAEKKEAKLKGEGFWFVIGGQTKVYESKDGGDTVTDLGVALDAPVGLGAIAIGGKGKEGTQKT